MHTAAQGLPGQGMTDMSAASLLRKLRRHPRTHTMRGSPRGAVPSTQTVVPGVRPMSMSRLLRGPWQSTLVIVALYPGYTSPSDILSLVLLIPCRSSP